MNGILKPTRLAQRLLCTLAPMLAAGCLWPTSLTDAVNDNQNVRPVLISADPLFGAVNRSGNPSQTDTLTVTAEDPNPGTGLTARLFKLGSSGPDSRVWTGLQINSLVAVAGTPNTYTGAFYPVAVALCDNYPNMQELFVVVADAPFNNASGFQNQSTGLTNENHWQLVCQ